MHLHETVARASFFGGKTRGAARPRSAQARASIIFFSLRRESPRSPLYCAPPCSSCFRPYLRLPAMRRPPPTLLLAALSACAAACVRARRQQQRRRLRRRLACVVVCSPAAWSGVCHLSGGGAPSGQLISHPAFQRAPRSWPGCSCATSGLSVYSAGAQVGGGWRRRAGRARARRRATRARRGGRAAEGRGWRVFERTAFPSPPFKCCALQRGRGGRERAARRHAVAERVV